MMYRIDGIGKVKGGSHKGLEELHLSRSLWIQVLLLDRANSSLRVLCSTINLHMHAGSGPI